MSELPEITFRINRGCLIFDIKPHPLDWKLKNDNLYDLLNEINEETKHYINQLHNNKSEASIKYTILQIVGAWIKRGDLVI